MYIYNSIMDIHNYRVYSHFPYHHYHLHRHHYHHHHHLDILQSNVTRYWTHKKLIWWKNFSPTYLQGSTQTIRSLAVKTTKRRRILDCSPVCIIPRSDCISYRTSAHVYRELVLVAPSGTCSCFFWNVHLQCEVLNSTILDKLGTNIYRCIVSELHRIVSYHDNDPFC